MVPRDSGTGYVVTIWAIYHVRRGKISIFSVAEKDIDKAFTRDWKDFVLKNTHAHKYHPCLRQLGLLCLHNTGVKRSVESMASGEMKFRGGNYSATVVIDANDAMLKRGNWILR